MLNKVPNAPLINVFYPFSTNVPLLYPLKTSENLRFTDVFRGYRSGTLVESGLSFKFFCVSILITETVVHYTSGRKGSMNLCLFVLLPASFIGIGTLLFFRNSACCQLLMWGFAWQSQKFWEKSSLGKNYQKWSKMTQKWRLWPFFVEVCHQIWVYKLEYNEITNRVVIFCNKYVSEKILVHKVQDKILSSNQIAGFFDHQYHWKELINILDFLYGGIHQGKVASATNVLI